MRGFDVKIAGPDEPTHRVLQEDVEGVWQVVLEHVEQGTEEIIIGALTGWAVAKISRNDDPEPEAGDASPQANLWLPDGTMRKVPLPMKDDNADE